MMMKTRVKKFPEQCHMIFSSKLYARQNSIKVTCETEFVANNKGTYITFSFAPRLGRYNDSSSDFFSGYDQVATLDPCLSEPLGMRYALNPT